MTKNILIKKLKIFKNKINTSISLEDIKSKDLRAITFTLEAILRLYQKHAKLKAEEQEIINDAFNFVKYIEDSMGQAFVYFEMLEVIKNSTELDKIKSLIKDKEEKTNELFSYFKSREFNQRIDKVILEIKKVNFLDDEFILKAIKKEIKRIDSKINQQLRVLIKKNKYAFHEMEEGVHEWRRMIRWIALYIQSHKHLFILKLKKKHNRDEIVKKYKNNKFCKLADKGKFEIDAKSYYYLSHYIQEVGELKTRVEVPYFLNNNYHFDIEIPKIEEETQVLFKEFKKSKVLKKLF